MFYLPDFFIYLLLLPVILLIVIPALLATLRSAIGFAQNVQNKDLESLEIKTVPQV